MLQSRWYTRTEEIGRVCKRLEANASLSPLQMLIQFSSIKFRNLLDVYRAVRFVKSF